MYVPAILANWTVWPCTFYHPLSGLLRGVGTRRAPVDSLPECSRSRKQRELPSSSSLYLSQSSKSSTSATCLSPTEFPSSRLVGFSGLSSKSPHPSLLFLSPPRFSSTSSLARTDFSLPPLYEQPESTQL